MRNSLTSAIAALALVAFGAAEARDDRQKFPIKAALKKSDAYKEKIEKTNAFNKSDQEACDIAFISAAAALQDRARREGGSAVVNIRSVYKKEDVASETEYLCGSGAVMAGVALRGTVVTLKGKK
jgi:hypothetical protein